MNGSIPLPPIPVLKTQAKRLRATLGSGGTPVGHGRSLELIAHQYGYKDWNTLRATADTAPAAVPYLPGQRVSGHYLGQAFDGEILGVRSFPETGRYRLDIRFNRPVDVVRFESFSNHRRRISCTVGKDGTTAEKTSDGKPHLTLARTAVGLNA